MTDRPKSEPSAPAGPLTSTCVAVIGGGPAGLVAALALTHFGVPTALVAPSAGPLPDPSRQAGERRQRIGPGKAGSTDNRTTALMMPSVTALEALGVWPSCRHHAAP